MEGWIHLHRTIFESKWVQKPFTYLDAWIWLCLNANWQDGVCNWDNQIIEIKRGQILTSQRKLAKIWGWSQKRVRTFLKRATKWNDIGLETASKWTMITICKYDTYNNKGHTEDAQKTHKRRTEDDNIRSKEGKELKTCRQSG